MPRYISSFDYLAWLPPLFEALIINFDAAVQNDGVGIAFIIRDGDGTLSLAQGVSLPLCSIPYTKLLTAWLGLKATANFFKNKELMVQGNSLIVIYYWIAHPNSCLISNLLLF